MREIDKDKIEVERDYMSQKIFSGDKIISCKNSFLEQT